MSDSDENRELVRFDLIGSTLNSHPSSEGDLAENALLS